MTTSATQALVTGAVTDFGTQGLVILGAVLGIGVGLMVFYFGWRKLRGSAK